MYIFLIILSSFFMRAAEDLPYFTITCDETCAINSISRLNLHYSTMHYYEIESFYKKHVENDTILKCYINQNKVELYKCEVCSNIRFYGKKGQICSSCHKSKSKLKRQNELSAWLESYDLNELAQTRQEDVGCDICKRISRSKQASNRHIAAHHWQIIQDAYVKSEKIIFQEDNICIKQCEIGTKDRNITYCNLCKKHFLSEHRSNNCTKLDNYKLKRRKMGRERHIANVSPERQSQFIRTPEDFANNNVVIPEAIDIPINFEI